MSERTKKWLVAWGAAFGAALSIACPNDSEDRESCACPGEYAWVCGVIFPNGTSAHIEGCTDDTQDAAALCVAWIEFNEYEEYPNQFVYEMCQGMVPEEDGETGEPLAPCDGWNPSYHVSVNQNVIEVDEALVEAILDDPSQLVYCDDAVIEIGGTSPFYSIDNISSGDLADELGLMDNDVFYSVNGHSLATKSAVIDTFLKLRLSGETEFSLTIIRGSTPVTLDYEIVP